LLVSRELDQVCHIFFGLIRRTSREWDGINIRLPCQDRLST
jgi:hypothetical protein